MDVSATEPSSPYTTSEADEQLDELNNEEKDTPTQPTSGIKFATYTIPEHGPLPPFAHSIPRSTRIVLRHSICPQTHEEFITWSFVPPATVAFGATEDPETWPREVNYLGSLQITTQDKWDSYKCDPHLFCYIPPPPGLPIVTLRDQQPTPASPTTTTNGSPLTPPSPKIPSTSKKRRISALSPTDSETGHRKRAHVNQDFMNGFQSESDAEEIVVSKLPSSRKTPISKSKQKKWRGPSVPARSGFTPPPLGEEFARFIPDNLPTNQVEERDTVTPKPPKPKEKFGMETDPIQVKRSASDSPEIELNTDAKRVRQLSPTLLEQERRLRQFERQREKHRRQIAQAKRRMGRNAGIRPPKKKPDEKDFWGDVDFSGLRGRQFVVDDSSEKTEDELSSPSDNCTEVPDDDAQTNEDPQHSENIDVPSQEDIERQAAIEESRRKLQELERDRPIWEAAARKRKEQEWRESQEKRAEELKRLQEEDRKRRLAAEMRRQQEAEAAKQREKEARRKLNEESERRRAEEKRRFAESTRANMAGGFWPPPPRNENYPYNTYNSYYSQSSSSRPHYQPPPPNGYREFNPATTTWNPITMNWSAQKALERYKKDSAAFDNLKVSAESPLKLSQIPWPVLLAPGYTLDEIDWRTVEAFFTQAEAIMEARYGKMDQWKEFLRSSTRRFHPDRWKARGFFGPHGLPELEEKVTTVSKALTPIYKAVSN